MVAYKYGVLSSIFDKTPYFLSNILDKTCKNKLKVLFLPKY